MEISVYHDSQASSTYNPLLLTDVMKYMVVLPHAEGLKKLDLNSKPAVKEFMNRVAVHIPHKWMEIGIQLDVPRGRLEAFNQRHLGESMKILVEVFNYWESQSGDKPKTWYTVIDALKTPLVGEHTLASDLESTSNSTTSCDR